LIEGV